MGARYLVVATMAALVVQVGCREQTLPTAPRSSAPPLAANAPVPVPGREVVFECFTSYQVRGDPLPYRYGHVGLPISGSEVDASAGHLFQFHYRRYAADGHVLRLANCQLPATPVAVAFATAFFRLRPQANARSSGVTRQPRIETSASEIVPPPPDFCSLYPSDPACLPMDPGTCDPTIDSCGTTGGGGGSQGGGNPCETCQPDVISYEITGPAPDFTYELTENDDGTEPYNSNRCPTVIVGRSVPTVIAVNSVNHQFNFPPPIPRRTVEVSYSTYWAPETISTDGVWAVAGGWFAASCNGYYTPQVFNMRVWIGTIHGLATPSDLSLVKGPNYTP